MTQPIRILITDDHKIVRKGLRAMLESEPDFDVVGEASNGDEAVSQVRALQPDVILMDLLMPHKDGLQAILEIKQEYPDARILVLTSFIDDEKIIKAVKAGALGYLPKDTSPANLFSAIQTVFEGGASLDPIVALKLMQGLHGDQEKEPLTSRESEVLQLVAQGISNREVAAKLVISERTVGTHVSSILSKLNLSNRVQLTLYALRMGMVSKDDEYP